MSPCLLIFGTKEKKIRKMFINLCEPISAVEKSRYSGMQSSRDIEKLVHNLLFPPKVRGNMFGHDPTVYLPTIYDGGET